VNLRPQKVNSCGLIALMVYVTYTVFKNHLTKCHAVFSLEFPYNDLNVQMKNMRKLFRLQ